MPYEIFSFGLIIFTLISPYHYVKLVEIVISEKICMLLLDQST